MTTLFASLGAVILLILTILFPATSVALQLVGHVFVSLILFSFGLTGGVTASIFGLQLLGIVVFMFRNRVWPFRFTKIEVMTFGIVLMMFISLHYTSAPIYGREKTLRFIGTCMSIMIAFRFFALNENTLRQALRVGGWCAMAVTFLYVLFFVYARDLFMESDRFGDKGSLIVGWSSAAATVLTLYLILGPSRLSTRLLAIISIFFSATLLVASGSRGPFAALLGGAFLSFMSLRSIVSSMIKIVFVGIIAYVALFFLAPEQGRERISQGFQKYSLAESGRTDLYRVGLSHYADHLAIGGGAGSFARAIGQGDQRSYPHNMVIEVACETGTVGLVLLGLVLWFCAKSILLMRFRMPSLATEGKTIQYLFWVGLANAMASFDLPDQRILFGAIGLLAAVPNLYRQFQENYILEEMEAGYADQATQADYA